MSKLLFSVFLILVATALQAQSIRLKAHHMLPPVAPGPLDDVGTLGGES